jgi:Phage terminase large subunit (GpA)
MRLAGSRATWTVNKFPPLRSHKVIRASSPWISRNCIVLSVHPQIGNAGGRNIFAYGTENPHHQKVFLRLVDHHAIWPRRAGHSRKYLGSHVWTVGVDTAKDALYSKLKVTMGGPGYCHFPDSYQQEYFNQLTSEQVRTRFVRGHPVRYWFKPSGMRNEALDRRVYEWQRCMHDRFHGKYSSAPLRASRRRNRRCRHQTAVRQHRRRRHPCRRQRAASSAVAFGLEWDKIVAGRFSPHHSLPFEQCDRQKRTASSQRLPARRQGFGPQSIVQLLHVAWFCWEVAGRFSVGVIFRAAGAQKKACQEECNHNGFHYLSNRTDYPGSIFMRPIDSLFV